jgi:hypothetical protein
VLSHPGTAQQQNKPSETVANFEGRGLILGQRPAPDGSQVVFAAIGGAASAWSRARTVGLAKCDSAAPGLSPESRRSGALAQAAKVSSFSSAVGLLCYNKRVALVSRGRSQLAP